MLDGSSKGLPDDSLRRLIISNRLLARTMVAADSVLPTLFRPTISLRMGGHYLVVSAQILQRGASISLAHAIYHAMFERLVSHRMLYLLRPQTCDKIHCNILQRVQPADPSRFW